jgi:hypothetical protein
VAKTERRALEVMSPGVVALGVLPPAGRREALEQLAPLLLGEVGQDADQDDDAEPDHEEQRQQR